MSPTDTNVVPDAAVGDQPPRPAGSRGELGAFSRKDRGPSRPVAGGTAAVGPAPPRSGRRLVVAGALVGAAIFGGVAWSLAGGGGGAAALPTVVVTAHHSRFTPERIAVEAGTTVRFVLHNADPISHELIVGPPEVHERHEKGTEAVHGAVPGEVSVGPNAEAETTYTFTEPGVVTFGCHLPGHFAYGMQGEIEVR